jgi:hypothetical protein
MPCVASVNRGVKREIDLNTVRVNDLVVNTDSLMI